LGRAQEHRAVLIDTDEEVPAVVAQGEPA